MRTKPISSGPSIAENSLQLRDAGRDGVWEVLRIKVELEAGKVSIVRSDAERMSPGDLGSLKNINRSLGNYMVNTVVDHFEVSRCW